MLPSFKQIIDFFEHSYVMMNFIDATLEFTLCLGRSILIPGPWEDHLKQGVVLTPYMEPF